VLVLVLVRKLFVNLIRPLIFMIILFRVAKDLSFLTPPRQTKQKSTLLQTTLVCVALKSLTTQRLD
jgi:hypothetical protein